MTKETIQGYYESQFSFPISKIEEVKRNLIERGFSHIDYQSPYVITVYFSTRDFEVPRSAYLRARAYLPSPFSDEMIVKDKDRFLLEIKPKDLDERKKVRIPFSYREILDLLSGSNSSRILDPKVFRLLYEEMESKPLIPYVATQYHRSHYIREDSRVTIDREILAYGFFGGEIYSAEKILEDNARGKFEIKTNSVASKEQSDIQSLILIGFFSPTPRGQSERDIRKAYKMRQTQKQ